MRKLIFLIILLSIIMILYGTCPAEPIDPYEPVPGAYDGLTTKEIEQLEAEREASRMIDEEVSRGSERVMVMEATAYTWTGQRTASGTWPAVGTVAVDPEVIPLGTRLWVEGYGEAVALDTGGAIKGNIIDVYLPTESECWQWGRRQVEVRVIAHETRRQSDGAPHRWRVLLGGDTGNLYRPGPSNVPDREHLPREATAISGDGV